MNWSSLLQAVLTLVITALLKMGLAALGVEIDEALLNTIVGAIVVWLLGLFTVDVAKSFAPNKFR